MRSPPTAYIQLPSLRRSSQLLLLQPHLRLLRGDYFRQALREMNTHTQVKLIQHINQTHTSPLTLCMQHRVVVVVVVDGAQAW